MVSSDGLPDLSHVNDLSGNEVDSLPFLSVSQTVPSSPSVMDYGAPFLLEDLKNEVMGSSVCGNIHQAQYFCSGMKF